MLARIFGAQTVLELAPGETYPITQRVEYGSGIWQVVGTGVHLSEAGRDLQKKPGTNGTYTLVNRQGHELLRQMIKGWNSSDPVSLYRGFSLWHRCIPALAGGVLNSEGDADIPTFTMGNPEPTRWLPFSDSADTGFIIGISGIDETTRHMSLTRPIPVGVNVRFECHAGSRADVCWLNYGEIVVRGPLQRNQFVLSELYWFVYQIPERRAWRPLIANSDLVPPPRPYHESATRQQVEDWLEHPKLIEWLVHLKAQGDDLAKRALTHLATA